MSLSESSAVLIRPPDGLSTEQFRRSAARIRRVAILRTLWYPEIMAPLEASAREWLLNVGVPAKALRRVAVPGSFELPLAVLQESRRTPRPDFVIALGCIVRGDTPHFDFVARAATDGLMRVQLDTRIPVGFGVLTVDSMAQAEARKNKGAEAAQAALFMYLATKRRD